MTSVNLHVTGASAGVPVVLLPAFPVDARVWGRVVARLDGWLIAVDPPGFAGASATGAPSLEAYATALLDALDAAGIDRFVAAGNSMGGYLAMALAEHHPARLAGLVLVGTKSTPDTEEARTTRLDLVDKATASTPVPELVAPMNDTLISAHTRAHDPEAAALLRGWLAETPRAGFCWIQRALAARPDRTDALARLRVPAAVLHGADDALMGPQTQPAMADALGVAVTTLPDAGHLLPLEAPAEVARAIEQVRAAVTVRDLGS